MPDEWEDKDWGRTRCTVDGSPHFTRHELELWSGGYCSFHYHKNRANLFRIVRGLVRVVYTVGWEIKHDIVDESGYAVEIRPMVAHQFQVLRGGEMIEDYLPCPFVAIDDIVRFTKGNLLRPAYQESLDKYGPNIIYLDNNKFAVDDLRNIVYYEE
jgi:mannose-6-phosphate isomerase-like protein (cupin superfamily)